MNDATLLPILRFVLAERKWPSTAWLERTASTLPAVPCAGLEFDLAGPGPVDLQMRIRTREEVGRLMRVMDAKDPRDPSWPDVRRFCEAGGLGSCADELWLELDDAGPERPSRLSAFVRLARSPRTLPEPAIATILDGFGYRASPAQQAALARCVDACAVGGRVSHLGIMLSRPGRPLCLVIDDLPADAPAAFLEGAGWPGSAPEIQRRLDALWTHLDRIRLVLTVEDSIRPLLGIECFLAAPGPIDPRWRNAFDWLIAEGLCDATLGDRVLRWPAVLTPASVSGSWPASLVAGAIARRASELPWIECRLSHLKLACEERRVLKAKAYVGFLEVWRDFAPSSPAPDTPAAVGAAARSLPAVTSAAVRFLLGARVQAGWWLDYDFDGVSDEWVTAYVAYAVHEAGCGDADAERAVRRAWQLLACRRRDGWGWNYVRAADADSTVWALRLASRLGAGETPRAMEGLAFLRRHVRPSGGVVTYDVEHHARGSRGARINPAWCDVHTCVTAAAAAHAAVGDAPVEALRRLQGADGSWQSYWWRLRTYATAHAVEALESRGTPADGGRIDRACTWTASWLDSALASPGAAASPFDVSLALRTLLARPARHAHRITAAIEALLAAQNEDGSWPASAVLSIERGDGA